MSRCPPATGLRRLAALLLLTWAALSSALAIPAAAQVVAPAATAPAIQQAPSPRQVIDLSSGWRFRLGGTGTPIAEEVDDAGWQRVDVPHSWNRVGSYTEDRDPRTDLTQGAGWYRLRFPTPTRAGARQFLQFDGVGTIAEVWLNGRRLGEHRGPFSRFRFDVTGLLRNGWRNLLVVRADNSERKAGSPTGDVLPLSGDFFMYGGLYRGVSLVTTEDSHVDLMDQGSSGVYVTTTRVAADRATLAVRTRVVAPGAVSLLVALDDAEGRTVASRTEQVAKGNLREVRSTLDVPTPRLWKGRLDPYLYRLRVEVLDQRRLLDRVVEPIGIREVAFDADRGFFLNGQPLPLHGVSRHQDMLGKGWALDAADHAADMALVEELGANTVRMAHYQHAPAWFDLADRAGMVVWAELPFVSQAAWTEQEPTSALVANARQQLTELIRQNYNRPGIVTWSVGNEVDLEAFLKKRGNRARKLLADLAALAKKEDPTRQTSFADCCEGQGDTPPDPTREMLAGATDLIGYNRYLGWYSGTPDQLGPTLDRLHQRHADLPMAVTEYGAGGATSQHSDDPRGGPVSPFGRPQPEEYQAWIIEQSWPQIAARPYLWASWLWNLADFGTRTRAEGDATDLNTKGLVTADRQVRKDAFYYLQANWSDRPVLHLTGRRYVDRAYPAADVRAYSNAPRATLTINGRAIGEAPCTGGICAWPAVRLDRGANVATVTATVGDRSLSDSVQWIAPDPRAGYAIDAGVLVGGVREGRRYGSDAFFEGGEAATATVDLGEMAPLTLTVRRGDFRYRLPLPAGKWRVEARVAGAGTIERDGKVVASSGVGSGHLRKIDFKATTEGADGVLDLTMRMPDGLAELIVEPD